MTVLFALLAGLLTVTAPCTLPLLPVLLGVSIGQTSRTRPAFIALGFITAFTATAVFFSLVSHIFGFDQNTLRTIAVFVLIVLGALMLWPRPFEWLMARAAPFLPQKPIETPAYLGESGRAFALGATLGLVWTPCAGPVLASILTVIATEPRPTGGALLLFVYAIGAAIPLLAIAYGGQAVTARIQLLARFSRPLQQAFGVLIIAFATAIYFQYDTIFTVWLSDFYTNGQVGL